MPLKKYGISVLVAIVCIVLVFAVYRYYAELLKLILQMSMGELVVIVMITAIGIFAVIAARSPNEPKPSIKCPTCKWELNRPGDNFCRSCSARLYLPVLCGNCGIALGDHDKYCGVCKKQR